MINFAIITATAWVISWIKHDIKDIWPKPLLCQSRPCKLMENNRRPQMVEKINQANDWSNIEPFPDYFSLPSLMHHCQAPTSKEGADAFPLSVPITDCGCSVPIKKWFSKNELDRFSKFKSVTKGQARRAFDSERSKNDVLMARRGKMATDSKINLPGLSRGRGKEDSGPAENEEASFILIVLKSPIRIRKTGTPIGKNSIPREVPLRGFTSLTSKATWQ